MSDKQGFIKRREFSSVAAQLPPVERWDGKGVSPDLFICAIGFEMRARAVSQELALSHSGSKSCVALVGEYQTNGPDNEENREPITTALQSFCSELRYVSADRPEEISRAIEAFMLEWADAAEPARVAVDLSGASGTFILSVLSSLFRSARRVRLDVLYAEPERYFPELSEFESALSSLIDNAVAPGDEHTFVEQGVSAVDVHELHPGVSVENRPDFIIAVPALRTSRLIKCLGHIGEQPLAAPAQSIYWILGDPPAASMKWRLELQRRIVNRQLASIVGKEASDPTAPRLDETNSRACSTRDYRQTLGVLIEQIDAHAGSNVWLVHMGAKLQAVGSALALASRSEVAVVSSRPLRFNAARYSAGIGALWCIRFDDLAGLLDSLTRIGQLVLETKIETSREAKPTL